MRSVSTLVLSLAVVLILIDFSSQTSNPGPSVPPGHSPAPVRHHHPDSSNTSSRASRSSLTILGYKLEELPSIRLIPYTNSFQRFKIRRYTFPRDTSLQMDGADGDPMPMPTEELTVLSTSEGDVFGIVWDDSKLHGIYTSIGGVQKLSKINIYSRAVRELTRAEAREYTLLNNAPPILENFTIIRVSNSPPRLIRFPILNRFES